MLHVPQLVITPPSREPTPLLIQAPADWERYPAIRGLTDCPPVPPPKPRDSHSPSTSRWGRRPPTYRPPVPAEPLNLPTPVSESSETQRWLMSGRARRSRTGEWERVSDDEKYSSVIHDAADDAFVYSDAKAREAGFQDCHSLSSGASLKHKHNHNYKHSHKHGDYKHEIQHLEYRDKEERHRASENAIEAAFGQRLDAELEADVDTSVRAFTTAYAHVAAQAQANVYGYTDSRTDNPVSGWGQRKRQNTRPPPPVQTLDLPGSFAATGRSEDKRMEVAPVVDTSRSRRRNSFWSLRR